MKRKSLVVMGMILLPFVSGGQNLPDSAGGPIREFAVKGDLLALGLHRTIIPEDRKIGPVYSVSPETREINQRIFLPLSDALAKGTIPLNLIVEENRVILTRDLEERVLNPDFRLDLVRYGQIRTEGDSASAAIRLRGATHDYTGLIYLRNLAGQWLIEDMEVEYSP